jgi:arylsulfatase A-like enzyme
VFAPPIGAVLSCSAALVAARLQGFWRIACVIFWVVQHSGVRAAVPSKRTPMGGPNVVVLVARDLGFSDLGCYGGELDTPYLDYLAFHGVRFTQAYHAAGPGAAEGSLLTGLYPQHVLEGLDGARGPAGGARFLPELLGSAGYRCYYSGAWSQPGNPQERGFERAFVSEPRPPRGLAGEAVRNSVAERACGFLRDHAEQAPEKPFFMLVGFEGRVVGGKREGASGRFAAGREGVGRGRLERLWGMGLLLNAESAESSVAAAAGAAGNGLSRPGGSLLQFQRGMEAQAARVEWMDGEVGRILELLKGLGVWDRTVVWFAGEPSPELPMPRQGAEEGGPLHAPLRESACGLHEAGIATPMIVHWPSGLRARGETREQAVHVVDVAPTVLKVAGWTDARKAGWAMDGVDLSPVLRENKAVPPRPLWWERAGARAYRLGDWKWIAPVQKPVELYYLREDRSEMRDVAEVNFERIKEMEVQWKRMAERFHPGRAVESSGESGR